MYLEHIRTNQFSLHNHVITDHTSLDTYSRAVLPGAEGLNYANI